MPDYITPFFMFQMAMTAVAFVVMAIDDLGLFDDQPEWVTNMPQEAATS